MAKVNIPELREKVLTESLKKIYTCELYHSGEVPYRRYRRGKMRCPICGIKLPVMNQMRDELYQPIYDDFMYKCFFRGRC